MELKEESEFQQDEETPKLPGTPILEKYKFELCLKKKGTSEKVMLPKGYREGDVIQKMRHFDLSKVACSH